MRNPWANTEWNGDWGDSSPLWKKYPLVKERVAFKAGNDGVFWMTTDDFATEFQAVHVCMSDTAVLALLAQQKRKKAIHRQMSADKVGEEAAVEEEMAEAVHRGSGAAAPSINRIPEMTWILYFGELEKSHQFITRYAKAFPDSIPTASMLPTAASIKDYWRHVGRVHVSYRTSYCRGGGAATLAVSALHAHTPLSLRHAVYPWIATVTQG
jgi:hypothetical protein